MTRACALPLEKALLPEERPARDEDPAQPAHRKELPAEKAASTLGPHERSFLNGALSMPAQVSARPGPGNCLGQLSLL